MDKRRQYELLTRVIDGAITITQTGIYAFIIVALAHSAKDVLIAFSGKTTTATVSLSLLTKLQADRWFAYMFGAGGVAYGLAERQLRRRNIKRMSKLNVDLEKRVLPNRTSSGLTQSGTTRKGDD